MKNKLQIPIFILLILILAVFSAVLVLFHPLTNFDALRPIVSFFVFTLIAAIAKEIQKKKPILPKIKKFKLIFPKIKRRKPPNNE